MAEKATYEELEQRVNELEGEVLTLKVTEKAFMESEERYRSILDAAPDSITITRVDDGCYLEVNDSFCLLSGYSREEALGKTPFDLGLFVNPEERQHFVNILREKGEVKNFELQYKVKDGSIIHALLSAKPLHYAGEDCLVAVVADITERKRAEEALQQSEEKYRTILESIEEGYFEVDLAGNMTFANNSLCTIAECSREELMSMNSREYTTAETAKKLYKVFNEVYRTGNAIELYDVEVIIKNDKKKILELSASLMHDQEDNPIGFRGIVRDVTETKKLQAQLQHAQKMESIGTIASGVAHNFRNILAGISANTQLMEIKYQGTKPLMEIASRVSDAIDRGSRLINELMQFSHKESSKDLMALDLTNVIREIYELIRKSFDMKIDIKIALPETLPVMGDHSGLNQVIMNLCINARDSMPEGGALRIEAKREGDNALVVISDTGHGMSKEARERCFDPFFTTKGIEGGTGLGLSTSYGIIKEHGGDIHVYSESEYGTTFKIYIPLAPARMIEGENVIPDVIHGRGEKILVVDDEIDLLKPLEALLEAIGYRVTFATSGEEALVKYESLKPAAVLLDRNMPEMDGITCAKELIKYDPNAKIILISGYDERGPNGIDAGTKEIIKGYLTKPINMVKLSVVLNRCFK